MQGEVNRERYWILRWFPYKHYWSPHLLLVYVALRAFIDERDGLVAGGFNNDGNHTGIGELFLAVCRNFVDITNSKRK
jgi:hypothetical protein